MFALLATAGVAQTTPKVSLDTSENLFTLLAAMNLCGYDQDLAASAPIRKQIRSEAVKASESSAEAKASTQAMCQFYKDHEQPEASRTLSQYVSLALYLNPVPSFTIKTREADLPPDASYVQGILPLMLKFYNAAGIDNLWQKHHEEYTALTERYHEPVAKMLFDTEVYLKLPSAGYLGRSFTVFLDPLGAPGQTNARSYVTDYYVVISPGASGELKMDEIRHTYLHYLLDPLALKYPTNIKRIEPLLDSVKNAPMDESFKDDISLLVTECLIRAIEIRTATGKPTEAQREEAVEATMQQGYVLTRYFFDVLKQFEKDPAGLRNTYGQMLTNIDVGKEQKRAAQVVFAKKADPELLRPTRTAPSNLLNAAQERLYAGDSASAQKLAQQALEQKSEDPGRALFILAQVATANRDIQGARDYFQKALQSTQEPKVVGWSHIYLGRIFDLQENREAALDQYRAALNSGASLPEVKAAAERGLQQPYEPPHHSQ
ncbi:MAG TPA: tetratricopeptide repeat protein [Terriglobales bacterium]|nr:tetratricopeptide repeat protein [Terriglobales bacterium]